MSRYTLTNGELYHYGVKGMKWGVRRADKRFAAKLSRAGRKKGEADYEREKGEAAMRKHEDNARVLDQIAKQQARQGNVLRAEAAKRSAAALRARGANVKAGHDARADELMKRYEKLNTKASAFATKKRVDAGKSVVDSILKESSAAGYKSAKNADERMRDYQIRSTFGDAGSAVYDRIRGK
jgi:hypothetical protein